MQIGIRPKFTQTSIVLAIIIVGLIYAVDLLIPLIFAIIFWVLMRKLKSTVNRVSLFQKHVPNWVKNLALSVIIIGAIYFISSIISTNIETIVGEYAVYEENFKIIIASLNEYLRIDVSTTIISVIIFSKFEKTKAVAILMSDKGNI